MLTCTYSLNSTGGTIKEIKNKKIKKSACRSPSAEYLMLCSYLSTGGVLQWLFCWPLAVFHWFCLVLTLAGDLLPPGRIYRYLHYVLSFPANRQKCLTSCRQDFRRHSVILASLFSWFCLESNALYKINDFLSSFFFFFKRYHNSSRKEDILSCCVIYKPRHWMWLQCFPISSVFHYRRIFVLTGQSDNSTTVINRHAIRNVYCKSY
jgi:hypothetical protein